MEQNPSYENPQISGIIMNDTNYIPVNSNEIYEPDDVDIDEEDIELEPEEMDITSGEPCRSCGDKGEDVSFRPCEEFKDVTVHNVHLQNEGRILKVRVELCEICRGRRIRLAVLLYEKECFEKRFEWVEDSRSDCSWYTWL